MKKLLTLFFIILLFSGCVPSEWQQVGFTGQEQKGNSYEDWQKEGYPPYVAGYYKKNGISLEELKKWKENGFKVPKWEENKEIVNYKHIVGSNIELAKKWKQLYLPFKWYSLNVNVDDALELEKYISPYEYIEWKNIGFNKKDIIDLRKKIVISSDEYLKWQKAGFNKDDIIKWKKAGFSLENAKKWKEAGFKPTKQTFEYSKFLSPNQFKKLKKANISFQEYLKWKKIGFSSISQIKNFKKLNISYKQAKKFKNIKSYLNNFKDMKLIVKNCPNGVRKYSINILSGEITNSVSELNPMATKGKCFNSMWKVSQILSPREIIVREYSEYDKYLGSQFDGRQSMFIFKKLPEYITENVEISGIVKGIGYEKMSRSFGGDVYVDKFIPIIIEKTNIQKEIFR